MTVKTSLWIIQAKTELEKNYLCIKKLYKLRNTIIHGNSTNENLSTATDELQDKVRQAINYCLPLNNNKKQLFDKFNAMGFDINWQDRF